MSHCEVICEIGSNHQGRLKTALEMIDMCADAGADTVKFQKRTLPGLYTKSFYNAPYNSENAFGATYGAHRAALEFGWDSYGVLLKHARRRGLRFSCTAFDEEAVEFLLALGVDSIKIASGDLTNIPLLVKAASSGLPVLVSTGGGSLEDVQRGVGAMLRFTRPTVLQCTASYPCPAELLDLGVITTYRGLWPDLTIGASLHDNGIWSAVAAYVLGARVIEKHVTLDRTMKGTDQAFSLEPQGVAKLVRDLRRAETALGETKRIHPAEEAPILKMSKALFASRSLTAGTVLHREDIISRSPGGYLPPYELPNLIGRCLLRDLDLEEPFTKECVDAARSSDHRGISAEGS